MASGPLTPPDVPSLPRAVLEEHILARMLCRPGDLPDSMASLPLTTFTRRLPARRVLATGYVLVGVGFALNAFARTVPALAACVRICSAVRRDPNANRYQYR